MLPALSARADQVKQLRQTILNLAMRGKLSLRGHCWDSPRSLGEVATLQNGYAFKSEWFAREGVRLLRNVNVSHGELSWKDDVCLPSDRSEEYSRFLLREGDVVLSLDRPFIASGTKAARVRARDLPALLLQRVGRFQPTEALLADFLYLWLVSPHFSEQVDPGRSNGVPHISSRQVEAALIFVPPIAEQQRIVAVVKELTAICDQLEASLANGEGARSRLLEAVLHRAIYSDSASVAVATTAFAMSKVRPQLKAKATRA
jgi:type I restriction enzyme S subunit